MKKKKDASPKQAGSTSPEMVHADQALAGAAPYRAAQGMLQRLSSRELATLSEELPDIFSEEQLKTIATRLNRQEAIHERPSALAIDEQIKTIAAYIREREESFSQLPVLPREALRQLIMIRKYASTEEVMQLEDRILGNLRKQFGAFDQSGLVMFLVKYLL